MPGKDPEGNFFNSPHTKIRETAGKSPYFLSEQDVLESYPPGWVSSSLSSISSKVCFSSSGVIPFLSAVSFHKFLWEGGKVGLWARFSGYCPTVRRPSVRLVLPRGFASFIVGLQIVCSLLEQEALSGGARLIYQKTRRRSAQNGEKVEDSFSEWDQPVNCDS